MTNQQVVDLIFEMKSKCVCMKKVVNGKENAASVINPGELLYLADWLKDDFGTWRNRGYNSVVLMLDEEGKIVDSVRVPRKLSKLKVMEDNELKKY